MTSILRLVTPYDEDDDPLTIGLVRDGHLRVTNGSVEDGYIQTLIQTSLDIAQAKTQRRILRETWAELFCAFDVEMPLSYAPLIEVESVQYVDPDGVTQTLATSVYDVVTTRGPFAQRGMIRLAEGQSWPSTQVRPDAVTVTYRTGYVTAGSPEEVSVPVALNRARLLIIKDLYESRGSKTLGTGVSETANSVTADGIFWDYRVH